MTGHRCSGWENIVAGVFLLVQIGWCSVKRGLIFAEQNYGTVAQ